VAVASRDQAPHQNPRAVPRIGQGTGRGEAFGVRRCLWRPSRLAILHGCATATPCVGRTRTGEPSGFDAVVPPPPLLEGGGVRARRGPGPMGSGGKQKPGNTGQHAAATASGPASPRFRTAMSSGPTRRRRGAEGGRADHWRSVVPLSHKETEGAVHTGRVGILITPPHRLCPLPGAKGGLDSRRQWRRCPMNSRQARIFLRRRRGWCRRVGSSLWKGPGLAARRAGVCLVKGVPGAHLPPTQGLGWGTDREKQANRRQFSRSGAGELPDVGAKRWGDAKS